jgi:hypothetical protein
MALVLFEGQDNKYNFTSFPNSIFICEKGGDKQFFSGVKIPPGLGSFRYICAS